MRVRLLVFALATFALVPKVAETASPQVAQQFHVTGVSLTVTLQNTQGPPGWS